MMMGMVDSWKAPCKNVFHESGLLIGQTPTNDNTPRPRQGSGVCMRSHGQSHALIRQQRAAF